MMTIGDAGVTEFPGHRFHSWLGDKADLETRARIQSLNALIYGGPKS